ncbi:4-(cytidine 5'-diphospho)-2-C-methyl-D-erythritol kinase [Jonesia quinghaiensis]|uniref:4-(cytidine 5'-diphospho)-2-C-methyl-D-erythritol kinase n=1 Tax=Jonesia quinghaiensis TaxID=262806 RepID=UPI00041563BE
MNTSPNALLGPAHIRELAERFGVTPTKTKGQNFLHDAGTVRKIVRLSGVEADQQVLEVGPGLGSLTLGLLEAGCRVTAIELDTPLAVELPGTVEACQPGSAQRLTVVEADALDVTQLPGVPPSALVANLPYNVSVPILLTLLERFDNLETIMVMVQREVADRLVAEPGSRVYGSPSVKLAWYGKASRAMKVGRNVFWPAPNVDSALVYLQRTMPVNTPARREDVFAVVDAAFAQRRKTLRQALSGIAGSSARASEVLEAAGVSPMARGEQLDVHDFARVAAELFGPAEAGSSDARVASPSPVELSRHSPAQVTARAPGKVNLSLRVGPVREDGYHPLINVFQAVNLFEEVTASPRIDDQILLTVQGVGARYVPLGESNLVTRAARLLQHETGHTGGANITITKTVPVAGGMAGGSADAAATLVALNALWRLDLSDERLRELGAQLGADVPFSLFGGTAVGYGKGDDLHALPCGGEFTWVFALRSMGLSTPSVFQRFDALFPDVPALDDAANTALYNAIHDGDAVALGEALHNDLQPAALDMAPDLQLTLDVMLECGALGVLVSGSGPTTAALARSREHAQSIAEQLIAEGVCADALVAGAPVRGAHLL